MDTPAIQDIETSENRSAEAALPEENTNEEEPKSIIEEQTTYFEETTNPKANSLSTQLVSALKLDLKSQIEAILFVTDAPLKTGAIAKMLNASYDDVQSALVQLIQEYEDRNGGLEIGTEEGYIIQVKADYLNIVTDMLPLELSPGPLRTLSAIALKEPVKQSEIIDIRGSSAYEHINELVEQELITKKPEGLTYILKTTKKFTRYFRLTKDGALIKQKLQEESERLAKEKEKRKQEEDLAKAIPEVVPE